MKLASRFFILAAVLTMVSSAVAQELAPKRISEIKRAAAQNLNEIVRVEGFVTQFVDEGTQSTKFYTIKDDWGTVIRVRTSKEVPSVGKRYDVKGPLTLDSRSRELFISEESRREIFKPIEPKVDLTQSEIVSPPPLNQAGMITPPAGTGTDSVTPVDPIDPVRPPGGDPIPPVEPRTNRAMMYTSVGGAAVLILAFTGFLFARNKSSDPHTGDFRAASLTRMDPLPVPEQVIEGRTIKLHAPPPNTVKLMPGWFEVVSGDDVVKQIRFYNTGGDNGTETTFGRATGRPYAHIQLKAPTVSSRQAKLAFENGVPKLTNFASSGSNPTKINGRELTVNETVDLKENDLVEMGEVGLRFRSSAMNMVIS
jgi:hypothetical protein